MTRTCAFSVSAGIFCLRAFCGVCLSAGVFLPGPALQAAEPSDAPRRPVPALSPQKPVTVLYRYSLRAPHPSASPSGSMFSRSRQTPVSAKMYRDVRVFFADHGDKMRIEQIGAPGVTILNRPLQTVYLINSAQKTWLEIHPQRGIRNPFLLDGSMQYAPQGYRTIVGQKCQEWEIQTPKGDAEACIAPDGLILAENGVDADGVEGELEARKVTYGPIDAALFAPPEKFRRILIPKAPAPPATQGAAGDADS